MNRERAGWYLYDFANSAFYTTVVTLLFAPYLDQHVIKPDAEGYIYPFGIPVYGPSYWGYLVSLSVILQVALLPVAGAKADRSPRKKQYLGVFAYIGAAATMAMAVPQGYLAAGFLFIAANLSFGASIVVYNSFLNDIAAPGERDAVSSKGWGIGYLGGGLMLAFNLAVFRTGLDEAAASRLNLFAAGAWWALFTIFPMLWLRKFGDRLRNPQFPAAFTQLAATLRDLRNYPRTLTFLVAYMLYNEAIQAVIAFSGQFGKSELDMSMSSLALAILMVQFVAFLGALAFNLVAAAAGTKNAVMSALAIWTGVIVAIYLWVRTVPGYFIAAAAIAAVLGGSQALSRSLYSQIIPKGREAEYFSLYEISEKGTSWLAPLFFGLALQFSRSYRLAILSLIVFFVAGMILLARVDVQRAAVEAGQTATHS